MFKYLLFETCVVELVHPIIMEKNAGSENLYLNLNLCY